MVGGLFRNKSMALKPNHCEKLGKLWEAASQSLDILVEFRDCVKENREFGVKDSENEIKRQ